MTGEFQRYLRAKRTVDDRALDRRLVGDLRDRLAGRAGRDDGGVRVLEAGAGIGTMLVRFLEWDVLPAGEVHYTAVDLRPENVAELRRYVRAWADDRPFTVTGGDTLVLEGADRRVEVDPTVAEAVEYAEPAGYDLLVGAALLDLLDASDLEALLAALDAGGLYYFPITFDGATRFLPAQPADRAVERRYHDHMDAKPGGSSRAGSEVLARLRTLDGVGAEAAGSDWVVAPADGSYPADEAYFLRYVLGTVEAAVREITGGEFRALDDWVSRRRAQVDAGELVYLTHQLDLLGRVDDPAVPGAGPGSDRDRGSD